MTEEQKQQARNAQREYAKAWRAANPEKVRSYNARYAAKNREKLNAYKREWKKANPQAAREIQARYWMKRATRKATESEGAQLEQ